MKKWFIYASIVGLAAGVVFWLCKNGKTNTATSQTVDKKADFETNTQEEEKSQNSNVVEEMYQIKSESVQAVYERHSEAGSIMKDAYSNIMEDFVEDFSRQRLKLPGPREFTTQKQSCRRSWSVNWRACSHQNFTEWF